MDFFILVIGHARISYEGNVKVAPFTANDKRKISWKFLKIRKMSGQKQSKTILMDGNNVKLLIFCRSKEH